MIILPVNKTTTTQRFVFTMERESITVFLRFNVLADRWSISLERAGVTILAGQRLVIGTSLLSSHNFKLGELFLFDARLTDVLATHSTEHAFHDLGDPGADPGRTELDDTIQLIYASEAELDAAIST